VGLVSEAAVGVRWSGISALSKTALEAIGAVVLARLLSPADFGLMAMIRIVIGFTHLYMDFGISGAIVHRQHATHDELSSLYCLNIFTGLGAFAVAALAAPMVASLFADPRLVPLLRTAALVFVISPVGQQFQILLEKHLRFEQLARAEIVASLVGIVTGITSAVIGLGVWSLVVSSLAATLTATALYLRAGLSLHRPSLHFRWAEVRNYIGFGLFQLGERTLNHLAERFDQILIGPLLGARALGFYSLAFNLTGRPVYSINPILTRVAFPLFSKVQDDNQRLQRGYLRLIRLLTTINAPLLIGLLVVAPVAIPVIYGSKWSESVILVQILSVVSLLRSTGNPIGSLQLAKGRADLGFWWNVALFAVSIPAIYLGGRWGGAPGVALALLLISLVMLLPSYFFLIRPLIGNFGAEYAATILKPTGLACIMGLGVFATEQLLNGFGGAFRLVVEIILGAALYTALNLLFRRRFCQESLEVLLPVRLTTLRTRNGAKYRSS
jgi:lipopolysaccharide exporter